MQLLPTANSCQQLLLHTNRLCSSLVVPGGFQQQLAALQHTTASNSHNCSSHTLRSPANAQQQQQQQLTQWQQPQGDQQQPAPAFSWLQQLAEASTQQRLSVLSKLAITLQGHAADKTAGPWGALQAAASLLPRAAMTAVAAAATAAAAPAGASLAYFEGSRYRGSNSLSLPGDYWLRQMGMDHNKVTAALVAANLGCFGMQQISPAFTSFCVRVGYKVAAGEYWRLLTAAFVHGNLLHAGINTFALWNIGRALEAQLGSRAFLAVYLGSAITGNLLGYWMGPGFSVSMGSSSSLFGLLGAFLSYSIINRNSAYVSKAQITNVLQVLGINAALMLFFGGMMDNWAHLGGLLGGAALGAVLGPRY